MSTEATARRLIRVGHSPDPDDAFMFYALAHKAIDTGELDFQDVLKDIETLNLWAFRGVLEVTAVSLHAYAFVHRKYALMACGASLGHGYGPILVARPGTGLKAALQGPVAVPGRFTTAHLAAQLYAGKFPYIEVPFDEIVATVARGEAPAGLVIHEGQLTYSDSGLLKLLDLGEWWAQETSGLPLPLGVDAIRRDLGPELMQRVTGYLHRSIRYALEHRQDALTYAMQFGRGLNRELSDRFVGMYVNESTLDFGESGRQGVEQLLRRAYDAGLIPDAIEVEFVYGP
ncbi:MAG: MqnA/MqnD/SBP family protein [Candidatus Eremiobacterota bacterium]